MSRFDESDDDGEIPWEFWAKSLEMALHSRRGLAALRELREALLALPGHRLISRALCTVGRLEVERDVVSERGEGVCLVGAYARWKAVKSGKTSQEAFAELPTLDDDSSASYETVDVGENAGVARVLAWQMGYLNDEEWITLGPEERWQRAMTWVDEKIQDAEHNPARRAPRRVKRKRRNRKAESVAAPKRGIEPELFS